MAESCDLVSQIASTLMSEWVLHTLLLWIPSKESLCPAMKRTWIKMAAYCYKFLLASKNLSHNNRSSKESIFCLLQLPAIYYWLFINYGVSDQHWNFELQCNCKCLTGFWIRLWITSQIRGKHQHFSFNSTTFSFITLCLSKVYCVSSVWTLSYRQLIYLALSFGFFLIS